MPSEAPGRDWREGERKSRVISDWQPQRNVFDELEFGLCVIAPVGDRRNATGHRLTCSRLGTLRSRDNAPGGGRA
jgi:hypothetical protein